MPIPEIVKLTAGDQAECSLEASRRLMAYRAKRLSTDMTDGKFTRIERMIAGVRGEAAFLKYMGEDIAGIITHGELDGGMDCPCCAWMAQIKTAMTARPRVCYSPKHIPVKAAAFMVQAAVGAAPDEVALVGWTWTKTFLAARRAIQVGSKFYQGIPVSELQDMTILRAEHRKHRAKNG